MATSAPSEQERGARPGEHFGVIGERLGAGRAALEAVVDFVLQEFNNDVRAVFAGSVPYLRLAGIVLGGWPMAREALAADRKPPAGEGDATVSQGRMARAR